MAPKSTGMLIDGIFASEAIDSSGEVLDVGGCDISDLKEGKALANWEHRGDDAPGASASDNVGKIVYARKIMSEADAQNDRERYYWGEVKLPYIYGIIRLFDGAGHRAAGDLAAEIRDHVANNEQILTRFSIEGSTMKKDGNKLLRSVARRVAVTVKPCNRTANSGLLLDPNAPVGWEKLASTKETKEALENVPEETKKFEHPLYTKLGGVFEYKGSPWIDKQEALTKALEGIQNMKKTLEAGNYNAAPGSLTGGSALSVEDPSLHRAHILATAKAALRDWDGTGSAKAFIKSLLPEASDEFMNRFEQLAHDVHAKKTLLKAEPGQYGHLETQKNPGLQGKPTWEDKVRKAEDESWYQTLEKGAMQRLAPFNPLSDKDRPDPDYESTIARWQGEAEPEDRMGIPDMASSARRRALHRLTAATTARTNPETGEREYLLHRGVSREEFHAAAAPENITHPDVLRGQAKPEDFLNHDMPTSWTPNYSTARRFASDYSSDYSDGLPSEGSLFPRHVLSAWVPEGAIGFIPKQYGQLDREASMAEGDDEYKPPQGENAHSGEHEVIVNAHHNSRKPTGDEVESYRNIHGRINAPRTNVSALKARLKTQSNPKLAGQPTWEDKVRKAEDENENDAQAPEGGGDASFDVGDLDGNPNPKPKGQGQKPRTEIVPEGFKKKYPKIKGSRPTPKNMSQSYFDENTGILHTNKGSFPMQIPDTTEYNAILNGPEVQPHHDEAMRHWLNVHNLLEQGKLPPAVAMHAAMFSAMSPANPVPLQEIAYSHIVDQLHQGMDPSKPGGVQSRHIKGWKAGVLPGKAHLPDYMHDYWAGPAGDNTRKIADPNDPNAIRGRGEQRGEKYPQNKINAITAYHKFHPDLIAALKEHGSDMRTITTKLINQKNEAHKYDQAAIRKEKKTGERVPHYNEAMGKADVEGFRPKTLRYLLGMIGGGNGHVADTHFVRHAFGLPQDDQVAEMLAAERGHQVGQGEKAFAPNQHIKDVLWSSPRATEIGEGIDRYYQKHHPAVKYAQQRFFQGRDDPQAVFPGFWAHWLSIGPHERQQGIANNIKNGGTDHRVYWNQVNQILQNFGLPYTEIKKGEAPGNIYKDAPLSVKTVAAHRAMEKAFGPEAAMWFYMKHLLPLLLAHTAHQAPKSVEEAIRKMENLAIGLNKITSDFALAKKEAKAKVNPNQGVMKFGGQDVAPGEMQDMHQNKLPILHDGGDFFVVRHKGKLKKVQKDNMNKEYTVVNKPKTIENTFVVDSQKHGLPGYLQTPEQHALIHGMDLKARRQNAPANAGFGVNREASSWRKNAAGKLVYVKGGNTFNDKDKNLSCAHREAIYHNVARDFFKLGHYLPQVAAFKHPETGEPLVAIEGMPNARHKGGEHDEDIFKELGDSGELDKMGIMNSVMHNVDRHRQNYMFTPDDPVKLKLIDHGLTMQSERHPRYPDYLGEYDNYRASEGLHPKAVEWLNGLEEKDLHAHLEKYGVPDHKMEPIERKLRMIKDAVAKGEVTPRDLFDNDRLAEKARPPVKNEPWKPHNQPVGSHLEAGKDPIDKWAAEQEQAGGVSSDDKVNAAPEGEDKHAVQARAQKVHAALPKDLQRKFVDELNHAWDNEDSGVRLAAEIVAKYKRVADVHADAVRREGLETYYSQEIGHAEAKGDEAEKMRLIDERNRWRENQGNNPEPRRHAQGEKPKDK